MSCVDGMGKPLDRTKAAFNSFVQASGPSGLLRSVMTQQKDTTCGNASVLGFSFMCNRWVFFLPLTVIVEALPSSAWQPTAELGKTSTMTPARVRQDLRPKVCLHGFSLASTHFAVAIDRDLKSALILGRRPSLHNAATSSRVVWKAACRGMILLRRGELWSETNALSRLSVAAECFF